MMMFFRHHWKAIVWVVIIALACLLPSSDVPSNSFFSKIPHFDKIAHAGLYFVFTLLLISGYMLHYPNEWPKAYLNAGLIAFSIGASIEFLQSIMHVGRSGDVFDMLANTLGIILGLLLFKPIQRIVPWAL